MQSDLFLRNQPPKIFNVVSNGGSYKIVVGSDLIYKTVSEFKSTVPFGSAVIMILSAGKTVSRSFRREYKISEYVIADDKIPTIDDAKNVTPLDDERYVVAYGDKRALDLARMVAKLNGLRLIFISATSELTDVFSITAQLLLDGIIVTYSAVAPELVICDYNEIASTEGCSAGGFGDVMSCFVAVAELNLNGYINGGEVFNSEYLSLRNEVARFYTDVNGIAKCSLACTIKTVDCAVNLAIKTVNLRDKLNCSGIYKLLRATKCLFNYEKRKLLPDGYMSITLADMLIKIYREFFSYMSKDCVCFPPDCFLRSDNLCEYLGLNERVSSIMSLPYEDTQIKQFRLNEYECEIYDVTTDVIKAFSSAMKIFRRMQSDDGYFTSKYFDSCDLCTSLYLAPHMGKYGCTLDLMYSLGLLENLVP